MRKLQEIIGYQFQQSQLLQLALTHRSYSANHNERLEFLGDSLLNFIIGHALYVQFPDAKEGELSRLRALLVKGETLTDIAKELKIGGKLRLGSGERKAHAEPRASILADAVEALIGAVYLDSDMESTQALVLNWYRKRLAALRLDGSLKDPKSRLQELLQSQHRSLPDYSVVTIRGKAHQQEFTVECAVENLQASGCGKSRKIAEQEAAAAMLEQLENPGGKR